MEFQLQCYVRSEDSHPFDFFGKFDNLDDLIAKLKEQREKLNKNVSYNLLIEWNKIDGRYEDCLRADGFSTIGRLKRIFGNDTNTENQILEALSKK